MPWRNLSKILAVFHKKIQEKAMKNTIKPAVISFYLKLKLKTTCYRFETTSSYRFEFILIFANIFHHSNFIDEHNRKFLCFFAKIHNFDFRTNHILIVNLIVIWKLIKNRNKAPNLMLVTFWNMLAVKFSLGNY